MDYACPVWRSAARSHIRKLQVLQSKCLVIATGAPWYKSNRRIHEDLVVPFFADHMRDLTESFNSKLADAGNPLIRQLGSYLRWPRVNLNHLQHKLRVLQVRVCRSRYGDRSTNRILPRWHFSAILTVVFPWFFRDFSSVVRQFQGVT